MPSFGLGGSFSRNFGTLQISGAATYFVWHGLGLGLEVSDTVFFYGRSFKETYPGIERQTTTNIFEVMPSLLWVFVPRPRFSPYVTAAVGPVVFNHGGGVHGRWRAGAGAYIGIGGPAFLALGVSFTSMFPQARCRRAFEYEDAASNRIAVFSTSPCGFTWGPVLSLGFAFGGRADTTAATGPSRRGRDRPRPAPAQTREPARPPPKAPPASPAPREGPGEEAPVGEASSPASQPPAPTPAPSSPSATPGEDTPDAAPESDSPDAALGNDTSGTTPDRSPPEAQPDDPGSDGAHDPRAPPPPVDVGPAPPREREGPPAAATEARAPR